MLRTTRTLALIFLLAIAAPLLAAENDDLKIDARAAMRRAAEFYYGQVATHGGYVYFYSEDLQTRWGEGLATADQIWVQPPGTPAVGLAFVRAFQATGDKFYLDTATDAALALCHGQLRSGGWTNLVDFDSRSDQTADYRNGKGRGKNNSTLDDGISQGAIRLLMHTDRAHQFKHERIHEAASFALQALLNAQFANGGFPQVWTAPPSSQEVSSQEASARGAPTSIERKASYPDYDWRSEGRIKEYWYMYTLNDGLAGDVADVLLDAHLIYADDQYENALRRLGDFLLLAQMPPPQPAWAQQYNRQMQPIWARKFEPAAIAGRESEDVLATLMKIYRATGDRKYLQPIPAAIQYLRGSLLADGRLARYYELQTNRPLYMQRDGKVYSLTYDDNNLPSHYGWKVTSHLDHLEREYNNLVENASHAAARAQHRTAEASGTQAQQLIDALDPQGRWISIRQSEPLIGQAKIAPGARYLSSEVFSDNLTALSAFVQSGKK